MKSVVRRLAIAFLSLTLLPVAWGSPITITTVGDSNSWTVRWNDGSQTFTGPGFQVFGHDISLTSTSFAGGATVGGGSTANWNGVWFAWMTFDLPANALSPILSIFEFWSDDRSVIYLNGVPIADRLVDTGAPHIAGLGRIYDQLTGSGYSEHNFANTVPVSVSGDLFVLGGANTLLVITNNTGVLSLTEPARTFQHATDDRTSFRLSGSVTYLELQEEIPEPSTWISFGSGLIALGWHGWRRHRNAGARRA
jgi:hypothetical protein